MYIIIVEVIMNMSEYGSWRPEQRMDVNFQPIIRALKSDILDWDQV